MNKKIIAFILLLLLNAYPLIACAEKAGSPASDTTPAVTDAETAAETEWYTAEYLPDSDYEGYLFRFVSMAGNPSHVAEENGDIVNDAYYTRNRIISERYNVTFEQTDVAAYPDLTSTFKKSVLAASDDFDLCRIIMRDAFSCALEGYVMPLESLTYVDITKEWYIHYVNDELTIGDTLYFAYSDECMDAFTGAMCVFFNKGIVENLNMEDPYDLVVKDAWTLDVFLSTAMAAISDMDGDGKMTTNDRYGINDEHDMLIPSMWVGAGIKTIEKDGDNLPYFAATGNEKLVSLLETFYDNWIIEGFNYDSFLSIGYDEKNRIIANGYYMEDKGLYTVRGFGTAESLREMVTDFGIVPLPKYTEDQTEYYSRICDGWLNIVPFCAPNTERTSLIMEALAVETKNYVIPAYYENALLNKFIRDEESVEMLNIIQTNRTLDLGDSIWYTTVREVFINCFRNKTKTFASAMEKNAAKISKTIDKAIEAASGS